MKKLKDLQDELGRVVQEQRSLFDAGKNKTAEERVTYDATSQRANDLIKQIEDLKTLESREAMLLGGNAQLQGNQMPDEKRHQSAFEKFARYGYGQLDSEERALVSRATGPQNSTTGADGGFLIPTEIYSQIVKGMKAFGGMLEVASVMSTAQGNPLQFDKIDDTANVGRIVTENSTIDEAEKIALSKVTLGSFMYTSDFIKVPYSLLRDSFVDFNMIVTDVIAERVGRVINTHATIGTGSGQPTGIVTASTQGVAAAASAITLDNILGLVHSVDPAYRGANAKFMLNDSTLMAIRTLKDGQGRYVWDMGNITQGVAPTLWGYGYQINQDMPNIGTGLKSMLFGDMSKYRIRKVGGARLKRLEERFVENDQVAFVYLEAFDGNLLDTKAVKALVHA